MLDCNQMQMTNTRWRRGDSNTSTNVDHNIQKAQAGASHVCEVSTEVQLFVAILWEFEKCHTVQSQCRVKLTVIIHLKATGIF